MPLIKLDAIDSTNDFLKQLAKEKWLENYTAVMAFEQTKGRGQMGSEWVSEPSKNLTVSVLVKDVPVEMVSIYDFNVAVALAGVALLQWNGIEKVNVKWPNDIMSYNKKIGGILIENSIKGEDTITSIVGLGLNVNQTNFENLPKASSLAVIANTTFDKGVLLKMIIENLELKLQQWNQFSEMFWSHYTDRLFKKGVPMPFSDQNNINFMGIIQGVSTIGKLQVLLEDDSIAEFDIKEIQMLY